MRIIATKENLSNALNKAIRAISPRPVIPIMGNILFYTENDRLVITASDKEITIITRISALIEEEGAITLPAKKFHEIISALPNSDVIMDVDEENVCRIKCKNSNYKINGLYAGDYPRPEKLDYDWTMTIKANELIRSMNKVVYARSNDDSRKQLNGVVMSLKNGLITVAATDGRRLALVESASSEEITREGDYILPSRASVELGGCLDANSEINISFNKFGVIFQTENTTLITKLVEGNYPNFRQVIPENCGNNVSLQRVAFMDALKRVALIVKDNGGSVKLTFNQNQLVISAVNPEMGESMESLEIAYEGEEVSVSFNPIYFTDPLKIMEADIINIEFGKQYTPIKLTGDEGFLYMLMPMRG